MKIEKEIVNPDFSNSIEIQKLLEKEFGEAPRKLVTTLTNIISKFPSVFNESLIVSLANSLKNITMYGREINDALTEEKSRKTYQLHPYRKAGSGADCMATYKNSDNENYVLLGKKKLRGNETSTPWILLGGYFQPYPLDGHIEGIEKLSEEEKDQLEELILAGCQNAYKEFQSKSKEEISKKIRWDKNIEACAIRELLEEATLSVENIKPVFLRERSEFPDDTPSTLQTLAMAYLFDLGKRDQVPPVKPGSDIEQVRWVKFSEIKNYTVGSEPIREAHKKIIEKGAKKLLDKNILECSGKLLTIKTLKAYIKQCAESENKTIEDILGKKPGTYLGAEGTVYSDILKKIASSYKESFDKKKFFGLEEIQNCITIKPKSNIPSIGKLGLFGNQEIKNNPEIIEKITETQTNSYI